jgi:hypothetical protein
LEVVERSTQPSAPLRQWLPCTMLPPVAGAGVAEPLGGGIECRLPDSATPRGQ